MMISSIADPLALDRQPEFDASAEKFWQSVDWALDIREAQFIECDIRGIPARLIRRDEETQVIVRREKAAEGEWRRLALSDTQWPTALQFMLDSGDPDTVLVASKRDRAFKRELAGLRLLRDAGIAE